MSRIQDHVKCLNCETPQFVPLGSEVCPVCGVAGTLAWVSDELPESFPSHTQEN